MQRIQPALIAFLLLLAVSAHAQLPANFSWINIESDQKVMPIVRSALHDANLKAISKVGIETGYALVITQTHDDGVDNPDNDLWKIYSVSMSTGKASLLVAGYGVKILTWLSPTRDELAITYDECWGCEPATLFTTFRLVKDRGWQARWLQEKADPNEPQPGAVLIYPEEGGESPQDAQIYAIVKQPNDNFAVGNWMHSRNEKGKFDDQLIRYSIDPATGVEKAELLKGPAALAWKRELCTQANILIQPSAGQDSNLCRAALKIVPPHLAK